MNNKIQTVKIAPETVKAISKLMLAINDESDEELQEAARRVSQWLEHCLNYE